MKKTLDILEEIYRATKQLGDSYEEEGSLLNDVSLRAVRWLADVIQEAQEKDLISKDMAKDYQEVLRDIMQHNGDYYDNTVERIQNLKYINNKHHEDIKEFDEKSKESLDLDNVEVHNSDKEIKNSNDTLDYIKGLMQRYQSDYDSLGAMGATDAFYRIGNEIKEALKRNGIDKETAKKLIKPLEDMRDNIFDKNLQYQKTEEFYSAVESSFSEGNSNDKTILEKAVDKLHSGEEKGGKEADEKPEEESKLKNMFDNLMNGRDKKQENKSEKKPEDNKRPKNDNEHIQETKDVKQESQIDKDSKEKAEKDKEKSVEEKTKEQQNPTKTLEALDNIKNFINTYNDYYKSGDFGSATYELDKLYKYLGSARREGVISNGLYKEYRDTANKIVMDPNNAELQKKVTAQLLTMTDKRIDDTEKRQTPNDRTIRELKRVVNMFDRQHSDQSFKNMMLALKDLSDKKMVSKEMVDMYRHIFNETKTHRNTEKGILNLSAEIENQIAELEESGKEDIVKQQPNQEHQPKEDGVKDEKKQEKEVQEPKKEDIEKQAKPEELKPKDDNGHKQETKDVKQESQIDKDSKEKAEKDKEKSVEEKTKKSQTKQESLQEEKNSIGRAEPKSVGQEEITEEKALGDLYDLLNKYTEEYQRYQDNLRWGDRPTPEAREASLKAWDNFINAYHSYRSKRIFSSPEMEKDFTKATFDVTNRDRSISTMRDILEKAIYQSANREKPVADNSFNIGQKQEKTDAQEKDIRNPNATLVQNNTLGDTEVRFNVKDSGLQQKREDLNPNINHEINHEINDKINHHNEHDVRQEPTVADWRGGIQKTKDLIQQQEKTAKLREAKNNVPNNQSEFDRNTMNNIAAWRRKMLQNG